MTQPISYPYAMPGYAAPMPYVQPPVRQALPRTVPPMHQAVAPRPTRPAAAPIVRGQSPDEARPVHRTLDMPSPEALGVRMPANEVDWTDIRIKLDRLGAREFTMTPLPGGEFQFVFRLPSKQIVEGHGRTESEAVKRAVANVGR